MSPHSKCDVAVVGAGPAGATAAYLLAKGGFGVQLIDKRHFPRPKLCAGLLTWKTVDLLATLFGVTTEALRQKKIITHACQDYRVYYGARQIGQGRLDFPFHFVQRPVYDQLWLNLAHAAGAQVRTGCAVQSVDAPNGIVTLADGQRLQARLIIGADGVWSKVRNALPQSRSALRRQRRHLAATIETFRAPAADRPVTPWASLHFGFLPWGYAWAFPGAQVETLGLAGLVQRGHRPLPESFKDFLSSVQLAPEDLHVWKGYALPYGNYLSRPAYQTVLLAGDACGLADPLLGEGIFYAHRSGQLAAQAIIHAGLRPDAAAKHYCAQLQRQVLRELRWINVFRTLLFIGGDQRRYRGLRLFLRLFPKRLEACVQGQRSFSRLLLP
jgi:geranylgeranyl reductase family protein